MTFFLIGFGGGMFVLGGVVGFLAYFIYLGGAMVNLRTGDEHGYE